MKKWLQIILFIVVVISGILMIDNLLFGLMGETCRCENPIYAFEECEYACYSYEGCEDVWFSYPGYCQTNICCTKAWNWCRDGIHYAVGYHCVDCLDCGIQ